MFIVLDDLMRILKKTPSTPLLAVIFECLFVFCFGTFLFLLGVVGVL